MTKALDAIETDQELPRRTGVVVIGGGIIGISTALALAEQGVAVTLVEKGPRRGRAIQPQLGLVPHRRARSG